MYSCTIWHEAVIGASLSTLHGQLSMLHTANRWAVQMLSGAAAECCHTN